MPRYYFDTDDGDGTPQRTMMVRVRDENGKTVLNASLVLRIEIKP